MKKRVLLLLAASVLLAALMLLIWCPFDRTEPAEPSNEATEPQSANPDQDTAAAHQLAEDTEQELSSNMPATAMMDDGITLESLYVSNFRAASGIFPEDGSDVACDEMFAITVDNQSNLALQYAILEVERDGAVYQFEITTLPAGARCTAYEKSCAAYPGEGEWNASISQISWFEDELNLHMEEFGIRTADKIIELTNNTDEPIPGPIYVYYKTLRGGIFDGGITYRASVPDGLAPGKSYNIMASHYSREESRLMFITYAP